jgi:hypothetical protein
MNQPLPSFNQSQPVQQQAQQQKQSNAFGGLSW